MKKEFEFPRQRVPRTKEGRKGAGVGLGAIKTFYRPVQSLYIHLTQQIWSCIQDPIGIWASEVPTVQKFGSDMGLGFVVSLLGFNCTGNWVRPLAHKGHEKYQHKFGHKTSTTRSFGEPNCRIQAYMGNIKIYLRKTWDERMDWIYTAQGKVHSLVF
jgi:hypothetical protein